MKTQLLLISLLISCATIHVQSQPQQVIATSGGSGQNGDTSIEWTLGEPVIATLSTSNTILTQGFIQPGLTVTAIKTSDGLPFAIEAYPNPTNDLLLIQLKNAEAQDFQYVLYDMNGKVLEQKVPASNVAAINMVNYPAGVYLLKVIQPDKEIKTFEIVKK